MRALSTSWKLIQNSMLIIEFQLENLYLAICHGRIKTVHLLLDRGANHRSQTPTGNTALLIACISGGPDEALAERLLDLKADPTIVHDNLWFITTLSHPISYSDKLSRRIVAYDLDFWLNLYRAGKSIFSSCDPRAPGENPCLLCDVYCAKLEETTLFVLEAFVERGYLDQITIFLTLLDNNYPCRNQSKELREKTLPKVLIKC